MGQRAPAMVVVAVPARSFSRCRPVPAISRRCQCRVHRSGAEHAPVFQAGVCGASSRCDRLRLQAFMGTAVRQSSRPKASCFWPGCLMAVRLDVARFVAIAVEDSGSSLRTEHRISSNCSERAKRIRLNIVSRAYQASRSLPLLCKVD